MKRLSRATRGNQMQNKPEPASDKSLSHFFNHRLTIGICILKAALHGFGFCCCSAVACQRCMQTCICVLRINLLSVHIQFGDSQQLRLVRILRSTVMVRVGGGWMALDEFLVKNDPCRGNTQPLYLLSYSTCHVRSCC